MSMAPQLQQDVRQAISAVNRRFCDAFSAGDVAGAARGVYTRDARLLPPGGETVQGRESIVGFWQAAAPAMGIAAVDLATVELHPLGDQAYEIGKATLTLAGGQRVESKFVVIWKQEEGEWRWDVDIFNMNQG